MILALVLNGITEVSFVRLKRPLFIHITLENLEEYQVTRSPMTNITPLLNKVKSLAKYARTRFRGEFSINLDLIRAKSQSTS